MRVAIEVVIEFVIVFCDRICDSVCDSTVGSDPLRIVATSLQIHLSSLCADAHRQTLVYMAASRLFGDRVLVRAPSQAGRGVPRGAVRGAAKGAALRV